MRHNATVAWVWLGLTIGLGNCLSAQDTAALKEEAAIEAPFQNEREAKRIYDRMLEALWTPKSLSYQSQYWWESRGRKLDSCTYTAWLRKANYFRIEARSADGQRGGTIVGDGTTLWLFWLGDRPHFSIEDEASYEKTRSKVYMKKAAPLGGHSIGHETGALGAGMGMPVIDPSSFYGYIDSLQSWLDGVKRMGTEKVGDEDCDVIEVSFMRHQRSWYLWVSQKDHLPRKLKEVVRVAHEIVTYETWSDIVVDGDIPREKFAWTPPEGWQPWEFPKAEDNLLKPGTEAPAFELALADGSKTKLSDYRDKIVWLYIWRAG